MVVQQIRFRFFQSSSPTDYSFCLTTNLLVLRPAISCLKQSEGHYTVPLRNLGQEVALNLKPMGICRFRK
jgi:hypothetical protein